jgi:sugar phosphate isomerase/epimerase
MGLKKPLDYVFTNQSVLRFGFRSPTLRTLSFDEKMALANKLGMSVIEPQIAQNEICSVDAAKAYKKAAVQAGINIVSAGARFPHFAPENAFVNEVEHVMEYMSILGVNYIFQGPRDPYEPLNDEEAMDLYVRRSQWIADQFSKHNFNYGIEVDKACLIETLPRTIKLVEQINRVNVYINYDPTNFYLNNEDPLEVFNIFKDRIINIHIKDGIQAFRKEVHVGEGELDYTKIINQLVHQGKEYTLFIEHCKSEEEVISAVRHIQKIVRGLFHV